MFLGKKVKNKVKILKNTVKRYYFNNLDLQKVYGNKKIWKVVKALFTNSVISNEIKNATHFNNHCWRNYTFLHSQIKIAKYLCFVIRECKQNFSKQNFSFPVATLSIKKSEMSMLLNEFDISTW